jgi:ankyrin repeat protein
MEYIRMIDMSQEALQYFDTREKCTKKMDSNNNSVLHYCVSLFNPDLAEYILNKFPDLINIKNGDAETPIFLAIKEKKIKMVRIFQKYSPDLSINTVYIENCYSLLIRSCDINLIKLLVPEFKDFQHYLFDTLIRRKRVSILQVLINHYSSKPGFDINYKCCTSRETPCDNSTMLGTALCFESFSMVKFLLDMGADIKKDEDNITELINLIDSKNFRNLFIQLFKTKNLASLEVYNHLLLHEETNLVLELLPKYPIDVNSVDAHNSSLLTLTSEEGNVEIVKYLLSKGANVNQRDNDGDTAIILAGSTGNYELINLLIMSGANVYDKNINNDSLFTNLAQHNYTRCLRYLKGYLTKEILRECLIVAVKNKANYSIEFLIKSGAPFNIKIDDIPIEMYIYYSGITNKFLRNLIPKNKIIETTEELECLITGEPIKYPEIFVKCDHSHPVLNSSLLKWIATKKKLDLTCQWCRTKLFNKYPYFFQLKGN